jgi:hypothetical protein
MANNFMLTKQFHQRFTKQVICEKPGKSSEQKIAVCLSLFI